MSTHFYFLQLNERKENNVWDLEFLSHEWMGTLSKDLFYFLSLTLGIEKKKKSLLSKTKTHAILI